MKLPRKVCQQCQAEEIVTSSSIIKKGFWLCSPEVREGMPEFYYKQHIFLKHRIKATLFKFVGTLASYEPFPQSRGIGKIKKNPKLLFYF